VSKNSSSGVPRALLVAHDRREVGSAHARAGPCGSRGACCPSVRGARCGSRRAA